MDLRDVDTGTSDPVGALLGHGTAPLDGPAIAYMAARLLPIAGFGLLLVSELAVYLFSLAAPEVVFAYLRHPVMAVHAASLSYYVREFAVAQPAMTDAFGRQVYPLRYVLWCGSVSAMLVSVYYVVECTLRTLLRPIDWHAIVMPGSSRPPRARVHGNDVMRMILCSHARASRNRQEIAPRRREKRSRSLPVHA